MLYVCVVIVFVCFVWCVFVGCWCLVVVCVVISCCFFCFICLVVVLCYCCGWCWLSVCWFVLRYPFLDTLSWLLVCDVRVHCLLLVCSFVFVFEVVGVVLMISSLQMC